MSLRPVILYPRLFPRDLPSIFLLLNQCSEFLSALCAPFSAAVFRVLCDKHLIFL
jgi:hypothetical protein